MVTGMAGRLGGNQHVPGMAECIAGEQLVAVDQIEQRHRLATQGVDYVAIIDRLRHLPLYRQTQILARQGVIIERSTLSFWMGYAAACCASGAGDCDPQYRRKLAEHPATMSGSKSDNTVSPRICQSIDDRRAESTDCRSTARSLHSPAATWAQAV
jgi:hypothetical protein